MTLGRLAHYSVRARDLAVSEAFYTQVLGLRIGPRPPFGFPGCWLYLQDDQACAEQGCVHLIGPGAAEALGDYLGARPGADRTSTGALDHIAFFASDWPACRDRLAAFGVAFSERFAPALGVRQVFLTDPDGVTIELNYPETGE
jgi:catechol 2,3-dioxygenase-like lactoylglutathione lyase family enzyme